MKPFTPAFTIAAAFVAPAGAADIQARLDRIEPAPAVVSAFSGDVSNGGAKASIDAALERDRAFIAAHHLRLAPGAHPTLIFERVDETTSAIGGKVALAIAPPAAQAPAPGDGAALGVIPGGKVVRFVTRRPYGRENSDYEDMVAWIHAHDLKPTHEAIEVLVRQSDDTPPGERLSEVYYPLS